MIVEYRIALIFTCVLFVDACATGQTTSNIPKVEVIVGPEAMTSGGPEGLGAWLTYGSARSKWMNVDNYIYSFEEEFSSRKEMIEFWRKEKGPGTSDEYLDAISEIERKGFLEEYVWKFFGTPEWGPVPEEIKMAEFDVWFRATMPNHRPKTAIKLVRE